MTYQASNGCGQPINPPDNTRLDSVDQTVAGERERKRVSESALSLARLVELARKKQKVLQSLCVVCLRLGLMAATWFQFSKWPMPH